VPNDRETCFVITRGQALDKAYGTARGNARVIHVMGDWPRPATTVAAHLIRGCRCVEL